MVKRLWLLVLTAHTATLAGVILFVPSSISYEKHSTIEVNLIAPRLEKTLSIEMDKFSSVPVASVPTVPVPVQTGFSPPTIEEPPRLPQLFQWDYPEEARRGNGIQGRVLLGVEVSETGQVAGVSVITSSGSLLLDEAAKEQLSRVRFYPARLDGLPVSGKTEVGVKFLLTDE